MRIRGQQSHWNENRKTDIIYQRCVNMGSDNIRVLLYQDHDSSANYNDGSIVEINGALRLKEHLSIGGSAGNGECVEVGSQHSVQMA